MEKDELGSTVHLAAFGTTVKLDVSGTPGRVALNPSRAYRVQANGNCFVKQGGSSVTATTSDAPLTANVDYHFVTGPSNQDYNYLSAIAGASVSLYITQLIYNQSEMNG